MERARTVLTLGEIRTKTLPPIPTVEKRSLIKSSTWLGSDLLTSTGQAALPPVFTLPTASSFDLPAPPETSQISSSSVASTLISNKKTITGTGEENSSVTPGWEKELFSKSIFKLSLFISYFMCHLLCMNMLKAEFQLNNATVQTICTCLVGLHRISGRISGFVLRMAGYPDIRPEKLYMVYSFFKP